MLSCSMRIVFTPDCTQTHTTLFLHDRMSDPGYKTLAWWLTWLWCVPASTTGSQSWSSPTQTSLPWTASWLTSSNTPSYTLILPHPMATYLSTMWNYTILTTFRLAPQPNKLRQQNGHGTGTVWSERTILINMGYLKSFSRIELDLNLRQLHNFLGVSLNNCWYNLCFFFSTFPNFQLKL